MSKAHHSQIKLRGILGSIEYNLPQIACHSPKTILSSPLPANDCRSKGQRQADDPLSDRTGLRAMLLQRCLALLAESLHPWASRTELRYEMAERRA